MERLGCGERPSKRRTAVQARDDTAHALLDRQTMAILVKGMVATQSRAALNWIINAGRQVLNLPSMKEVLREEQLAAAAAAEAEAVATRAAEAAEAVEAAKAAGRRSDDLELIGTVHGAELGMLRVFTDVGTKGKVIGWAPDAGQNSLPTHLAGLPPPAPALDRPAPTTSFWSSGPNQLRGCAPRFPTTGAPSKWKSRTRCTGTGRRRRGSTRGQPIGPPPSSPRSSRSAGQRSETARSE
jgi:hypothetical protein